MGREKKQPEPDSSPGAPEWMVTFSDCMTLLLTFFVLLLSFSSFDEKIFRRYKSIFEKQFSLGPPGTAQDAILAAEIIQNDDAITEGSEKPTLERGVKNQLEKETEPVNFHDQKIFLISSDKIFYGNGTIISLQGRKILSTMASFLKEVPTRVVISENCENDIKNKEFLGMERAWAVIEYMTKKQELDRQKFSISATGTVSKFNAEENSVNGEQKISATKTNRKLEIVLLERSIYN